MIVENAQYFRGWAADLRAMAAQSEDPEIKALITRLADDCEAMAGEYARKEAEMKTHRSVTAGV